MAQRPFIVRAMTQSELQIALGWSPVEGWNPGLYDAPCYQIADPNGLYMGFLDGEPVGCVFTCAYDERYGFLGYYLVLPAFRGRGYGTRIWQAGMGHLSGRTVGIDAGLTHFGLYQRLGFRHANYNIRYQTVGRGAGMQDPRIVGLSEVPLDEVLAYDREVFAAPRAEYLRCWIRQPEATALGILDGGRLAGFGMLRRARLGYKIGPLFADDDELAHPLLEALLNCTPANQAVVLDTPEANMAAGALALAHGMEPVLKNSRMYLGDPPPIPMARWFGVTNFELG
jgi:RimJ/RimL family protein N-acetyltransferase